MDAGASVVVVQAPPRPCEPGKFLNDLYQSAERARLRNDLAIVSRYFFHLYNDVEARDGEGAELPDLEAARDYARDNIRDMAGETLKEDGRITLSHRIDIEDEHGAVLATVMFRDVVQVEG